MRRWPLLLPAFVLAALTQAASPSTLVLVDSLATLSSHSVFLGVLRDLGGAAPEVALATSGDLLFVQDGKPLYDNLVSLAPTTEAFGAHLNSSSFAAFVDAGGNLLLTASSSVGDAVREVAFEFGFEMDQEGTAVQNGAPSPEFDPLMIKTRHWTNSSAIIPANITSPLAYRGIGLAKHPRNPLSFEVVTAPSTAVSSEMNGQVTQHPFAVGSGITLVGGLQALNNARVVLAGSADFFGDRLGSIEGTGNKQVARALAAWVFGRTGRIRVSEASVGQQGTQVCQGETVTFSVRVERETREGILVGWDETPLFAQVRRANTQYSVQLEPNGTCSAVVGFSEPGVYTLSVEIQRRGYMFAGYATELLVFPAPSSSLGASLPGLDANLVGLLAGVLVGVAVSTRSRPGR